VTEVLISIKSVCGNIWSWLFLISHVVESLYIKNELLNKWGELLTQITIVSFPPNHKVPSLSCTAERMSCGLLTSLTVSVGYEYESCLDLTLWEKRTAILQGYELDASNMGGWTLDKHHVLDVQNGKFLLTLRLPMLWLYYESSLSSEYRRIGIRTEYW